MSQNNRLKEAWKALRSFYPGLSPDAEVWGRQRQAGQAANDDEENVQGDASQPPTDQPQTDEDKTDPAVVVELVVQDTVLHPGWRYYRIGDGNGESEVVAEREITAGDESDGSDWKEAGYTRLALELEPMDLVECLANHLLAASRMTASPRLTDLMDRILTLTELASAALENGSLVEVFPEEEAAEEWLADVQDQVDRLTERA